MKVAEAKKFLGVQAIHLVSKAMFLCLKLVCFWPTKAVLSFLGNL